MTANNLPPLPEPAHGFYGAPMFTAEQMYAFRAHAVLQRDEEIERLRRAAEQAVADRDAEIERITNELGLRLASEVAAERERCAKLARKCASEGCPMLHNLADAILEGSQP
jgi:hypothetical protein